MESRRLYLFHRSAKKRMRWHPSLGPEFVIKVTGTVNVRPDKMINKDIDTGEVELCATGLEILNSSLVPVFEIDDSVDVSEDLRLTYRYLDIRRNKMLES